MREILSLGLGRKQGFIRSHEHWSKLISTSSQRGSSACQFCPTHPNSFALVCISLILKVPILS